LGTSTERQLTSGATSAPYPPPGISGDLVVWVEDRNGTWNIVVYDLTTAAVRLVPTVPERLGQAPFRPRISGDRVVWTDYRTDDFNGDIYCYDLKTNTQQEITGQALNQSDEDISGNTVVWMDDRDGSHIYMYEFPSGPRPPRRPRAVPFR
jgi:beta propeller repeat protein